MYIGFLRLETGLVGIYYLSDYITILFSGNREVTMLYAYQISFKLRHICDICKLYNIILYAGGCLINNF